MKISIPASIQSIVYDSLLLQPGTHDYELDFRPDVTAHGPGNVELPEPLLTPQLFGHTIIRHFLFSELGIDPSARWWLCATDPFTRPHEKPGDIDVLAFHTASPQRAVALEVKRIKIRGTDGGAETITKAAGGIAKGTTQANALARLGFSQTFLTLVIVADVRGSGDANFMSTNTSAATLQCTLDFVDWSVLDEGVGLFWIELPQATNRGLTETGKVNAAVVRRARIAEQPGDVTQRLLRYAQQRRDG